MSVNDELQAHTCEKVMEEYSKCENCEYTDEFCASGDCPCDTNVANNVAQANSQDLTEQWKKGWLDCGWYYVKGADGLFGMMSDYALYRVDLENPDNEISLLAKVPSYEEWQKVLNIDFTNEVLRLENANLKELLLECRDFVELVNIIDGGKPELLTKIDNAIGEK